MLLQVTLELRDDRINRIGSIDCAMPHTLLHSTPLTRHSFLRFRIVPYRFITLPGCGLNNGVFQVFFCQLFLFVGFWFSAGAIADCAFVELSTPLVVREDNTMATHIGLVSYRQQGNGFCYYWWDALLGYNNEIADGADQFEHYVLEVLGSNWYAVLALCGTACVSSSLAFCYSTLYCCSTHVRGVRLFAGVFCFLVTTVQAVGVYAIHPSRWCRENGGGENDGCTMGRSSIWGIVATSCFFLSGLIFFIMSDYPGREALQTETKAPSALAPAEDTPGTKAVKDFLKHHERSRTLETEGDPEQSYDWKKDKMNAGSTIDDDDDAVVGDPKDKSSAPWQQEPCLAQNLENRCDVETGEAFAKNSATTARDPSSGTVLLAGDGDSCFSEARSFPSLASDDSDLCPPPTPGVPSR